MHDPNILQQLAAQVQAAEATSTAATKKVGPAHAELIKANRDVTHQAQLAKTNATSYARAAHAAHQRAVLDAQNAEKVLSDAQAALQAYASDPSGSPAPEAAPAQ